MMRSLLRSALLAALAGAALTARAAPGGDGGDAAAAVARIAVAGVVIEALTLALDSTQITAPALTVRAARARLPAPLGQLTGLSLRCPRVRITAARLRCPDGTLEATHATRGLLHAAVTFDYAASGVLVMTLSTTALVGGTLAAELRADADGIHLSARARALDVAGALSATADSVVLEAELPAARDAPMAADVRFEGLSFSNA
ncbi:MAG: hypothetical protein RLW62_21040, partial [Gammaproteobacteria bacterium]